MENGSGMDEKLLRLTSALTAFEKQELREELVTYISLLLLNDFPALVQLLYRVDVSEEKLKTLLKENPETDAAVLIADLLIQRQQEKAALRTSAQKDTEIPPEEKW